MLLDSNAIIYFSKDNAFEKFSSRFDRDFFASEITRLEVLGFHRLEKIDKLKLERLFSLVNLFDVNKKIIEEAILLRQKKNISLGDAIIAGTAIVHKLPLVTANISDFKWIKNLELINPLI